MTPAYLLDANVFIEAWFKHYRPENFPGFWDWCDSEQSKGRIGTIQEVFRELTYGDGELTTWIQARKNTGWFLPDPGEDVQREFIRVVTWIQAQPRWSASLKQDFMSGADPWLVATALATGASVVTLESNDPNNNKKILLPIVCKTFGVQTLNTAELLRRLQARFGMG